MPELKTAEVRALVDEVIASLTHPTNEDVILNVFRAIESSPEWLGQYHILRDNLGELVVNQSIGRWTQRILGAGSIKQVPAEGTTLTQTYSTLRFK